MTELSELAHAERLKRYRELAADCLRYASRAKERSMKESYLLMASQWYRLAEDLAAESKREKG